MKNVLSLFFIFTLSLFLFPSRVMASGTFELVDFSDSYTATVGQEFKTYISFYYSGTAYTPKVSITGKSFPEGISLGVLKIGGTSLYNIEYSGVAKTQGSYSLTLLLTDDYGALLTKHFTINVNGLVFTDKTLPNATIDQLYTQKISFSYPGQETPRITFDFPESIYPSYIDPNGFNGSITIKFIPRKIGQFTFKAKAALDGILIGTRIFNITVDTLSQPPQPAIVNSVSVIPVNSAPVNTIVPPTPQPPVILPKNTPKKEETKPSAKKIEAIKNTEINPTATSSTIATSVADIQESTSTSVAPLSTEVKKENLFRRIWKKFISWF